MSAATQKRAFWRRTSNAVDFGSEATFKEWAYTGKTWHLNLTRVSGSTWTNPSWTLQIIRVSKSEPK